MKDAKRACELALSSCHWYKFFFYLNVGILFLSNKCKIFKTFHLAGEIKPWAGAGCAMFVGSPQSSPRAAIDFKSSCADHANVASDDENKDSVAKDDKPDIHFEPIVSLPEITNLTTGEENEDVVYKERAKLYRFCGNEWKERGVGDLKILKHKDTGTVCCIGVLFNIN